MRTVVRNSYTPHTGDYCNKIVIDQDNGVQYIFDSDGTYSVYTSKQQEGAPKFYVDSSINAAKNYLKNYADEQDAITLQAAKDYTDEHGGTGDVTKTYVDEQDAATLQAAKDYTDEHGGTGDVTRVYVDQQDTATLQSAKNYADAQDVVTLNSANLAIQAAISSANIPVITIQTSDPGEGAELAANHFIAVYVDGESE